MVEKIVKKETKIYIASDSKEFSNQWECELYEEDLEMARKEKLAESLIFNANEADWPSMCDPTGAAHEYKWFKLNTEEDLKTFCKAYESYNRDLKDINLVKPYIANYPDYICLIDFPNGPNSPVWYTLSYLQRRLAAFFEQFPIDENGFII